jgi:aarF domain-containing kinase
VAESVDGDIAILKRLADSICLVTGRKMSLDAMFEEFRSVLKKEVNFATEAEFTKTYRQRVLEDFGSNGIYHVPEIVSEMSTERVLTMSWQEGLSLREWMQSSPSRSDRERIAHAILELYCYEFFRWGLVQTDPNHANFLVRDQGELSMVLLDFGATREYTDEFRRGYIRVLKAIEKGDRDGIMQEAHAFNLLDPRESEQVFVAFQELIKVAIEPFFNADISRIGIGQKFYFGDREYTRRSNEVGRQFAQSLKYSAPPHHILFLHRKLAGIFSILKKLDIELDVSPYWHKMLELKPSPQGVK